MDIVLPFPPAANQNHRARKMKFAYCEECRKLLAGVRPDKGKLYMAARFFQNANGAPRGDIDNLLKTLLDALKGIVYFDDSQLCAMYIQIMDADRNNPRVELRVSPHRPRKNSMKGFFK